VARALKGIPSVWLPGGGYREDCWRLLAGTALVLLGRPRHRVSSSSDPLGWQFSKIAHEIDTATLTGTDQLLTQEDLADLFGSSTSAPKRLLDFYTAPGLEHALHRYGFLGQLERLGYKNFHVELDSTGAGDRMRVMGDGGGATHVLVECVVDRKEVAGTTVLFVNWLSLRNPRAKFSALRPALPGQEVPGLGLAREATELLTLMAKRLGLAGVAFRPAWFHMAYAARKVAQFVDAERQGRFEALLRDLSGVPLLEATNAVANGSVWLNGHPYRWEADDIVAWVDPARSRPEPELVAQVRERTHFIRRMS
jgi:hypothetical protein